jgi:hypothetical protein
MVPGHEYQRHVEPVHQVAQVLEGQVTAGQDEVRAAHRAQIGVQPLVHLVGDGEHTDHLTIVCAGPDCPRPRRSVGQRLPHVQAALAQRRLGPVDLGQRRPGAAGGRRTSSRGAGVSASAVR